MWRGHTPRNTHTLPAMRTVHAQLLDGNRVTVDATGCSNVAQLKALVSETRPLALATTWRSCDFRHWWFGGFDGDLNCFGRDAVQLQRLFSAFTSSSRRYHPLFLANRRAWECGLLQVAACCAGTRILWIAVMLLMERWSMLWSTGAELPLRGAPRHLCRALGWWGVPRKPLED